MSLAAGPIRRPVLTVMIYFIIVTVGVVSFSRLAIDLMPEVTFPTITVSASYGNIGPQEMEDLVTRPLEEALSAIQGVEEITSTSSEGSAQVRVSFTWGTDLDGAANDIRDRIDRIISRLPSDMDRPSIRKFDFSAAPVMHLAIASDMGPLQLREFVDERIKYRLERVPGVAAVDIWGGLTREIHVNLHADKLQALEISPEQVMSALRSENRNIPAGTYQRGNLDILVRTEGEFLSLEEISLTPIVIRPNAVVRIQDVAEVEDSWQEVTRRVRLNGKPGIRIAINKQSGHNTVKVADAVKSEIERINADFPQVNVIPVVDSSKYIRDAIRNMGNSAIAGAALAIIILLLFLRSIPSTFIVAIAIPVSVIATFAVMYFGGFTLNLMTFGGLALGIGMLVDSAIVVLENIYQHRERGKNVIDAALDGTSEVGPAIIASTLTALVVFAPVVFIRGISGVMFQQLALVVSFALLCSLMVSLTLIPLLSSRMLSVQNPVGHGILRSLFNASSRALNFLQLNYARILNWSLYHRKWVLLSAVGIFIISFILVRQIGVDLMPATDEGEVNITVELAVGTRLDLVEQAVVAVEDVVRASVPEALNIQSFAGSSGWRASGGHTGTVRVSLVPLKERKRSSEEIARSVQRELSQIPGVRIRTRASGGMFIMRAAFGGGSDRLQIEIRGHDLNTAQLIASDIQKAINQIDGITDTRISREGGRPEEVIRIDRFKAADLGVSISRLGDVLATAIGGNYTSNYRDGGKEYRILTRLNDEDRKNLDNLLNLTVLNSQNKHIQIRNVVNLVPITGPVTIERKDQERVIFVTGDYAGRDLGSIIQDIRSAIAAIPIPKDFAVIIGGDFEEQQKAFKELILAILLAVLLIYMVMAGQFESFRDPFIVMFCVPMALIGVVSVMYISGTTFSINALIGCIMLAGIVVNNSILFVDYTNQLRRKENLPVYEAIKLAGERRMRPIMMTALTTILALFPLTLGIGEGGETQAALARVVVGGLASATIFTLILIPVVYSIFNRDKK